MPHTLTISKKSFTVEPKYEAGHTLTAAEANVLNQTRYENLRNNFAKQAADGASQEDFDKYAAAYEFGVRVGGGGSRLDPVQAEAMRIAKERVKSKITSLGKKLSDFTAAKITELAETLLKKDPNIVELAKSMVAARQEAAVTELSDDDITSALTAETTEGSIEGAGADAEAPKGRGRKG